MAIQSRRFHGNRGKQRRVTSLRCEPLEDRRLLAVFTVTNTLDAGAGSLRQAIIDSNALGGADTINFAASVQGQTINLTTQMHPASVTGLLITDHLTIDASAGARVTISGNDTFRIFKVDDGLATDKVVEFRNLQIQHGNANNEPWTSNFANRRGGGIDNREALTIRNCIITQNSGRRGGGVSSAGIGDLTRRGSLTVIDSTISGNTAVNDQNGTTNTTGGRGAGIGVYNSSPVNIVNTIMENNTAASLGGGIDVSLGVTMTITDSIIRNNTTPEAGAAAYISQFGDLANPTVVTMDNVTITGNLAGAAATTGVILSVGQRATATISDSTIDNNSGIPLRPIFEGSSLTVTDSTISGNAHTGGFFTDGAVSAGQGATAVLIRTDVLNNTGMSGVRAISSTLTSFARIEESTISGNEFGGVIADVYGGATRGSDVEIVDSVISGNGTSPDGSIGGIFARTIYDATYSPTPVGTRLHLTRTTVSGNTVTGGNGGGILAYNFINIDINQSTIDGNQSIPNTAGAVYAGGGLWMTNSSANISHSTISNNSVNGNVAGGIGFANSTPQTHSLTISQSTVSGNSATGDGGGIWTYSGFFYDPIYGAYRGSTSNISLTGSTVTGNTSDTDNNGGLGGGLVASAYSNLAFPVYNADHNVTLSNSIVSQNVDGDGTAPDIYDRGVAPDGRGTPYITGTFSFIGINAGSGFVAGNPGPGGNKVGTTGAPLNAMLGALANNGGPTQTHLPLTGSPVIDAGDPSTVGGTDQRGFNRVVNGRVDMGSVEVQAATLNLDFNNDGLYNCGDMNLLEAAIDGGVYNPNFDVNQDLVLNSQDVFAWLIDAGELRFGPGRRFLPGDATLDGSVDGSDFGTWNANKFTASDNWCQGDFNQDNSVDGSDFGVWNANKFTSSDVSRPGHGSSVAAGNRNILSARTALTPLLATAQEDALRANVPASVCPSGEQTLSAPREIVTSLDVAVQRPSESTLKPAFQRRGIGWQDPLRHEEASQTTAIDRVFADLHEFESV